MMVIGIGAHPDDVEISFLGFLALLKDCGHEIGWVIATDGEAGGRGQYARLPRPKLANLRRLEADCAARLFKVKPQFLGLSDGYLDQDPRLTTIVSDQITTLQPDFVITHSPNDYHSDHRALSRATHHVVKRKRVPLLYADNLRGIGFEPNAYIDISPYADRKWQAIKCHVSQAPSRYVEMARLMNRFRAMQCSGRFSFAEALRFDDPSSQEILHEALPDDVIRPPDWRPVS
jgi:LmbE family N-acetylglucosaminyl deacetylase